MDATLTVRLASHRSTYRLGELIPLDLEFRGTDDDDLYFSTETYDYSGRMRTERFTITPADGVEDPLAEYFRVGGIGGGLRGSKPLDGTPFHLVVNLNEWVRFTRVGRYELSVSSERLHRYSGRPAPRLTSNSVTLEVVPASLEWTRVQVRAARAAIDRGSEDRLDNAVAILRHLDTRDAALALVSEYDRLAPHHRFDVIAGLVASPFRREIVERMERRVDEGGPLPPGYLSDLARLRVLLDSAAGAAPFDALKKVDAAYHSRWMRSVLCGTPAVDTLASVIAALTETAEPAFQAAVAKALNERPALAEAAFLSLPAITQNAVLQFRWSALQGPWIEPALERLYEAWRGDYRFPGAGDEALTRLRQLDARRGNALLLEEIRTGRHGIAYPTLASLPATWRPNLDAALRLRLERAIRDDDRAVTVWLMAQYGSDDLVPFVRSQLEGGQQCAFEAAAVVYLLKFDPESAVPRLQPGFDRRQGCVVVPWDEIAPRYWDARLEAAAIAHARGTKVRETREAIQILGGYGSAAVKAPLMELLAAFAKQWQGRADELDAGNRPPFDSPADIETALVYALLQNPNISLAAEDLAQIRGLCVTDRCRMNFDVLARGRQGVHR